MTAVEETGVAATDRLRQYRAGREGTVLADRSRIGRLAITGRDALDLLHRLTTNHVKNLRPGGGTATVFTTAKGRILDLVTLHYDGTKLLCLCGEGRAAPVREWIERYTFREEVKVEDLGASHGTLALYGPRAAESLRRIGGVSAADLPLHHMTRLSLDGTEATLVRTFPIGGEGFSITAPAGSMVPLRNRILAAGTEVVPIDAGCLEVLRIEAGLPAAGHELLEDYNPWEARLQDAIALDKGCYVGQEVIARLNTYDKVSRQLVRFTQAGGSVPERGAPLRRAGETIGIVTSGAAIPGSEKVVALGYVRDEDAVAGREVQVGTKDSGHRATIEGVAR